MVKRRLMGKILRKTRSFTLSGGVRITSNAVCTKWSLQGFRVIETALCASNALVGRDTAARYATTLRWCSRSVAANAITQALLASRCIHARAGAYTPLYSRTRRCLHDVVFTPAPVLTRRCIHARTHPPCARRCASQVAAKLLPLPFLPSRCWA